MQASSLYHKLFEFRLFFFESGKCGEKAKKLQKLEYLEKEHTFLDE